MVVLMNRKGFFSSRHFFTIIFDSFNASWLNKVVISLVKVKKKRKPGKILLTQSLNLKGCVLIMALNVNLMWTFVVSVCPEKFDWPGDAAW